MIRELSRQSVQIIPPRIRTELIRKARLKAAAAGYKQILPAGLKTSLSDCFTVDCIDGHVFILLYFNVPGGDTMAVRYTPKGKPACAKN